MNPTTQKRYRGGNVLALIAAALEAGWPAGQWATHKLWQSSGAQVRKGECGTGYLFWTVKEDRTTVADEHTGEDVELSSLPRFYTRAFVVFNAAQVDRYTPPQLVLNADDQIAHADAFFARVGAQVEHRCGCGA